MRRIYGGITSAFRRLRAAAAKACLRGHVGKNNGHPQSASDKLKLLSNLLTAPDLFPARIDMQRKSLTFVQMSRESFRRSSFLDRRMVRSGPQTFSVGISGLLPMLPKVQRGIPLHFVLHSAFCGSTLLARYLETLPSCLVLKEPQLLGQIATIQHTVERSAWTDWFKVTMALLGRAAAADTAVVIKTPDMCNGLGNHFLDHDHRTRIIFLFNPLRTFLVQVLKDDNRRTWLREHMSALKGSIAQVPFLTQIPVMELSDGQCAAAMWLLNSFLCGSLLAGANADRVLPLNGEDLIGEPNARLHQIADFLGLAEDEANRAALAAISPLSSHSKDPSLPYDAGERAAALRQAEARVGAEADAAISWAKEVALEWLSQGPFPLYEAGAS